MMSVMHKQNGRIVKMMREERRKEEMKSGNIRGAAFMALCLFMIMIVRARACVGEEIDLDVRINRILKLTHEKVRDLDGNGEVNCVDWSYTFKREWDYRYPTTCCVLLYNKKGDFNHMLVAVRLFFSDTIWTHVEPQAMPDDWDPVKYWKGRYDPSCSVVWPR